VTVAVLLSAPVNDGLMFAVSVNWFDAPEFSAWSEQVTVPGLFGAGVLHVAAEPVFCTSKLKVVPAGSVSEKAGFASGSGPLFVTVIVQEIVLPAVAVAGPVLVMARSLLETVVSVDDSLLSGFGSGVGFGSAIDLTSAMFWNAVVDGVPAGMWPISVKVDVVNGARLPIVHVTVPPEPAAGWLLQSKTGPLFCVMDTKVIVAGNVSVSATVLAASGPPLVTVIE
jgi:hypothetical protein